VVVACIVSAISGSSGFACKLYVASARFTPSFTCHYGLVRLAETWLKNTVLVELLREKNIVPTEKNKLNNTDYKVSQTIYQGKFYHILLCKRIAA